MTVTDFVIRVISPTLEWEEIHPLIPPAKRGGGKCHG